MVASAQRELLAAYMDWLVAEKNRVGYRELRPMATSTIATAAQLKAAFGVGFEMDCSESVTLLCHLAGLKPPSGAKDGWKYGNTETLLSNLPTYPDPANADVGAVCVFNSDRPLAEQHAAMVRSPGSDPVLFTHGSPADPSFLKLSQLQPGFAGETVFCSISGL